MIYVGIDDTDTLETRGTNQLAKALVRLLRPWLRPVSIVRHQLFFDPRVPYTSKNGSASILWERESDITLDELFERLARAMLDDFILGSDPGLCVTERVSERVVEFGHKCQRELVEQAEAREVAASEGLLLRGLGGTCQGIIGAVAAVGLIYTGQDGRLVQHAEFPDNLTGPTSLAVLRERGIQVIDESSGHEVKIDSAVIDVGKHLRPNVREGRYVVFVQPLPQDRLDARWQAIKRV